MPQGSVITCGSAVPVQARLKRTTGGVTTQETIDCPSRRTLPNDHALSTWQVAAMALVELGNAERWGTRTTTMLPAPVVVRDGDSVVVLHNEALDGLGSDPPVLVRVASGGGEALAYAAGSGPLTAPPRADEAVWRWEVTRDGTRFVSAGVAERRVVGRDNGGWGPLAVADPRGDGQTRIVPLSAYQALGLGALAEPGRDFRDLRYVDLDNDGVQDIVSNVYGSGCTLIAMARPSGGYDVRTPLHRDGSCIGGRGETIVVADFDGDGLVDVFLPSYERFDYLRNLGRGEFVEVADELGISFPWYVPRVEGAAAVDIDLDGAVDIVVANEVLLNDGTGHFARADHPFGPVGLHDEGMAVADVDGDGRFDIVKNDPSLGPRLYWGTGATAVFDDAGWMFGGRKVSERAFGLAVGDLLGDGRNVIVTAGGDNAGTTVNETPVGDDEFAGTSPPPRLCVQSLPRQFDCLNTFVAPLPSAWQDLLMVTDVDNDGADDLVARYGGVQVYGAPAPADFVFRIDLRDAQGLRNQFGRAVKAVCAGDGSFIALKFVDGGNGYMAQGNYVVSFHSPWCDRITLLLPSRGGVVSYGPFAPGLQTVRAGS